VDATGETVLLAALVGSELLTIEVVEGHHLMRMQGRIGQRQLFHASALGLAVLAGMPAWRVDELLGRAPLARLTPHTIVDRTQLRQRLAEIRTQGYSVDFEGVEEGLRCVGAAVRDGSGAIIGAISAAGPRHRLGPEGLAALGDRVKAAAAELGTRLGAPLTVDGAPT
jgi:DNA-binding IclR family transcriptional regulator